MFLSIIYWFLALGMDLLLVTAPASVQQCLSSIGGAGKRAIARAKGAAGVMERAGGSKRLRVVGGVQEAPADPNAVSMQTNSLMVEQLARGGGGGAGARRDLGKLPDAPPDAATWPAIKAAVADADRRAKELSAECERLRSRLEDAEAAAAAGATGGAAAAGSISPRIKRQFAPVEAARPGDNIRAIKALRAGSRAAAAATGAGPVV